jgi:cytochrome c oxidase subunit 2
MFVKRLSLLMFTAFALPALALLNAQATPSPAQGTTPAHEIQMTAKKYEYSPNPIRVKKGEHVRLIITATDRDHGFKLEAFNVEQKLKKGIPTTIEFTADKAGTFPFKCSVHCGLGHGGMKGTLIVEE